MFSCGFCCIIRFDSQVLSEATGRLQHVGQAGGDAGLFQRGSRVLDRSLATDGTWAASGPQRRAAQPEQISAQCSSWERKKVLIRTQLPSRFHHHKDGTWALRKRGWRREKTDPPGFWHQIAEDQSPKEKKPSQVRCKIRNDAKEQTLKKKILHVGLSKQQDCDGFHKYWPDIWHLWNHKQ